jgi:DDE superfamily endonuclease
LKSEWVVGSPPGSIIKVSDNGWISKEIFCEWAKQFVTQLPKSDNLPHLLLLDGHSTHIYDLEFIDLMTANNVHPYVFPPHTTHCLQPADKSFFKSLKTNWTNEGIESARKSGGRSLGKSGFFSILTPAWTKSCTVEIAQSGFRATGIFPLNRNIIPESAFAPSETSERPPERAEVRFMTTEIDRLL